MFGFIRELINPRLKCKRLGHDEYYRVMKGFWGINFRQDSTYLVQSRQLFCKRCDKNLGIREEHIGGRLTRLSFTPEIKESLQKTGYFWSQKVDEVKK